MKVQRKDLGGLGWSFANGAPVCSDFDSCTPEKGRTKANRGGMGHFAVHSIVVMVHGIAFVMQA
jgi:hypothetical protein